MDNLEYKGYYGSVEYSKEDDCLCGKVLGMSEDSITYEGYTIDELRLDFEAGVNSYLEGCEELGINPRKAFSGYLNIRIPTKIHSKVAFMAEKKGVSINALIKETLESAYLPSATMLLRDGNKATMLNSKALTENNYIIAKPLNFSNKKSARKNPRANGKIEGKLSN